MATNVTEFDDLTSCPICFQDFSEVVPHVPRILPCFHTLCENCVKQLLCNSSLECPEYRDKHGAPQGVKNFQQNKYVLAHMQNKRKWMEVIFPPIRAHCRNHGEELTMFCRESACEKSICHLCLVKNHKFHDVVDLEEQRKENYRSLAKDMEDISRTLEMNRKKMYTVQEDFEKRHEKSLKMLKLRKEELVRKISEHMDKLEANICKHRTDQDTEIQKEIKTIEINIDMIDGLQDDVNEMVTLEDIKIKREIVNNVCEEIKKRNTSKKGYTFLEYHTDQLSAETLEQICGKTRKIEKPLTSFQEELLAGSTIIEKRDHAFLQNSKLCSPKKTQIQQITGVTKPRGQENSYLKAFNRYFAHPQYTAKRESGPFSNKKSVAPKNI